MHSYIGAKLSAVVTKHNPKHIPRCRRQYQYARPCRQSTFGTPRRQRLRSTDHRSGWSASANGGMKKNDSTPSGQTTTPFANRGPTPVAAAIEPIWHLEQQPDSCLTKRQSGAPPRRGRPRCRHCRPPHPLSALRPPNSTTHPTVPVVRRHPARPLSRLIAVHAFISQAGCSPCCPASTNNVEQEPARPHTHG